MKNQIFIEVDTEKADKPFIISKPMEYQPSSPEEAKTGIINDISCVCEALCRLIITADNSGYAKREDLVKASISLLNGVIPATSENSQG
jgi:hypothetical protein